MKHLVLILCLFALCVAASAQQKADTTTSIRQVSYAAESPNVSNVSGNVTIIYGCIANEVSTINTFGSFGSATGINSSGTWNITNSSSNNNASFLAMSSILPPDNLNSAWHLSGTINSLSSNDTGLSLITSPSILHTTDMNDGFHVFDNAESVHAVDVTSSLITVPSVLPAININSSWQPLGSINSSSSNDTAYSLTTSPLILPTTDMNADFHVFDNAGSVHAGDVSASLIGVPSVLPMVNHNSAWQPLGTINSSTSSDTAFSLTTPPLTFPTADINSGLYLFDKADYPSTTWRPSSSMSAFHDYGVASGSDQASLNLRISDATTKGQEIIGWTLIYKDSVATK
jgi:hypothetical protein